MDQGARFRLKMNYSMSQLRFESREEVWVLGKYESLEFSYQISYNMTPDKRI
jgi:hypothetical protein